MIDSFILSHSNNIILPPPHPFTSLSCRRREEKEMMIFVDVSGGGGGGHGRVLEAPHIFTCCSAIHSPRWSHEERKHGAIVERR